MNASPEQNKDVSIPSRKRQRVNKDMNMNSMQVDSDHPHLNKLTSILNDLCKIDDKDKVSTIIMYFFRLVLHYISQREQYHIILVGYHGSMSCTSHHQCHPYRNE